MTRFTLLACVFVCSFSIAGCATDKRDDPAAGTIGVKQQEDRPTSPTGMDSSGVAGQN